MLLASYGDDGTWQKELDELLQAEHQEQEEMKKKHMVRLDEWWQMLMRINKFL
jgi:hypothetical protein